MTGATAKLSAAGPRSPLGPAERRTLRAFAEAMAPAVGGLPAAAGRDPRARLAPPGADRGPGGLPPASPAAPGGVSPDGHRAHGRERGAGVVGPDGAVHGAGDLYIADASLLPSSIGVNPMMTIVAIAARIARQIAERES